MSLRYDLIVIGGGPGGAACATFVAMQKHRVLLLEKSPTQPFKIGESLLPVTIRGICTLLGVDEEIAREGFVKKTGGRFIWGHDREPWDFLFNVSNDISQPSASAYQVERHVFDAILLRNAETKGVDVRFGHTALDVVTDSTGRATGVRYLDADGVTHTATARYIADASGQSGSLTDFVGRRVQSEFFRNIASFRYYKDAERLSEPISGNVLSVTFEHGWFWYIPLRNGVTSVGVVFGREYPHRQNGRDALFDEFLSQCPEISALLGNATQITEGIHGGTRQWRDYSYTSTAFYKQGVVLIGDAACFLDPLFASGVHLTTFAALLAARSINTRLLGISSDEKCFTEYEARFRREFSLFYDFIAAFYDVHHENEAEFWKRRKIATSAERENSEFLALLDGFDGFKGLPDQRRLNFWVTRTELGAALFPKAAGRASTSEAARRQRSRLLGSLFGELTRLQLQAMLQDKRPPETPIREGGLIPTQDGLHWTTTEDHEGEADVLAVI